VLSNATRRKPTICTKKNPKRIDAAVFCLNESIRAPANALSGNENYGAVKFTFSISELSIETLEVPIYLVSIIPRYLDSAG
jgi:hypothetical protein